MKVPRGSFLCMLAGAVKENLESSEEGGEGSIASSLKLQIPQISKSPGVNTLLKGLDKL